MKHLLWHCQWVSIATAATDNSPLNKWIRSYILLPKTNCMAQLNKKPNPKTIKHVDSDVDLLNKLSRYCNEAWRLSIWKWLNFIYSHCVIYAPFFAVVELVSARLYVHFLAMLNFILTIVWKKIHEFDPHSL